LILATAATAARANSTAATAARRMSWAMAATEPTYTSQAAQVVSAPAVAL